MPRDPLAAITAVATPQAQPVPGRSGQVRNNAGGYVFAKDLWTGLEDFLILGTTGGTYYLGEDRLTADNAEVVFQAVREDGPRVVALLTEISASKPPRAPRNRGCLFALAAASAFGDPATVQAVKDSLPKVARTTDHLSALFGYRKQLRGKAAPGGTWQPVGEISDALEDAYDKSFGYMEPSGRRLVIAVDSSGSMAGMHGWSQVTMGGSPLGRPYEIGCALAAQIRRIEGANAHVIDVDTVVHRSRITARTNMREIASWNPSGGGTDLSLPFAWASKHRVRADGFLILTDNETWAGAQHPFQALHSYRARYNLGARVVVAAMTAAGHTIGEPGDPGILNVAGMDASLPRVAAGFIR